MVWIDGHLIEAGAARIPAVSPGVQVGRGVFESLTVVRGVAFALTRHLRRLADSAAIVGLDVPVGDDVLREAAASVIAAEQDATKVRITVSAIDEAPGAVVVVNAVAQPPWPEIARLVVSPYVRNERGPAIGAKTTSYGDNVLVREAALRAGADEAVLCDTRGNLSEGTASNLFVVVDDEVCTPALSNGCLAGVTRALLCEIVPVRVRDDLRVDDLRRASEVFVTSSTRGVHPVVSVDGFAVAQCPGPHTLAAGRAFMALVDADLDP